MESARSMSREPAVIVKSGPGHRNHFNLGFILVVVPTVGVTINVGYCDLSYIRFGNTIQFNCC